MIREVFPQPSHFSRLITSLSVLPPFLLSLFVTHPVLVPIHSVSTALPLHPSLSSLILSLPNSSAAFIHSSHFSPTITFLILSPVTFPPFNQSYPVFGPLCKSFLSFLFIPFLPFHSFFQSLLTLPSNILPSKFLLSVSLHSPHHRFPLSYTPLTLPSHFLISPLPPSFF